MYLFKHTPLDRMKINQPFGVNYVYPGFYKNLGIPSDKHNGMDLSAVDGTNVYAVDDGWVNADNNPNGYGINVRLIIKVDGKEKYECVYGHLMEVLKTGAVQAGDLIAHSDNTGASTAAHLHFGVREIVPNAQGGWNVVNYNNGYFGCIDPQPMFDPSAFKLPVELKYGLQETFWQEIKGRAAFAPSYLWFLKTFHRGPSQIEYNALRYGFWNARDVVDPALFPIYTLHTCPEAKKLGLVK